jgi:two-component system nitrate/nitrite response regulator NarL
VADDGTVVRVLLADGHSLFREAMKLVLERQDDLAVVAEARDGMQAIAEAERVDPDVAMLEADLANGGGVHVTAEISARLPRCRILVVSDTEDEEGLVAALEAGAAGYITKSSAIEELIAAMRRLAQGEAVVPPQMLGSLLQHLIRRRRDRDDGSRTLARLTRREREVLALLAQGADNNGIAQPLVISPETARTHVQNVLTKLGVHSRLEAAAFVVQNGLLDELESVRT